MYRALYEDAISCKFQASIEPVLEVPVLHVQRDFGDRLPVGQAREALAADAPQHRVRHPTRFCLATSAAALLACISGAKQSEQAKAASSNIRPSQSGRSTLKQCR